MNFWLFIEFKTLAHIFISLLIYICIKAYGKIMICFFNFPISLVFLLSVSVYINSFSHTFISILKVLNYPATRSLFNYASVKGAIWVIIANFYKRKQASITNKSVFSQTFVKQHSKSIIEYPQHWKSGCRKF